MIRHSHRRSVRPSLLALEARDVPATIVALSNSNHLLTFDSAAPGVIQSSVAITGIPTNDSLVGIDFRGANNQLYGVTRNHLFTINMVTGAATPVPGPIPIIALAGSFFGVDLNAADQLRVVSDADINVRLNPNNGAATIDTNLAYAPNDPNAGANPYVVGLASGVSTSNIASSFGIDANLDLLVRLDPANDGVLRTVGSLTVNTGAIVGFDVAQNNTAFASLTVPTTPGTVVFPRLYSINLTTGAATHIGLIGSPNSATSFVRDIAVIPAPPPRQIVYGVTSSNRLITFDSANPSAILSSRMVTGLMMREQLSGLDFRPENGRLYAMTTMGGVYEVNPNTGAANRVAVIPQTTIAPSRFGFDFNPVADRLRIVSNDDRNFRVNVDDGTVTTDHPLAYSPTDPNANVNPNVVGSAYNNNSDGALQTILYGIDSGLDVLVRQDPPNDGVLHTIGGLGIDVAAGSAVGFDISGGGNLGTVSGGSVLAAVQLQGERVSKLYRINLGTGVATLIGPIGLVASNINEVVTGISIGPAFIQFSSPQYVVEEGGNASAIITLRRTGDTSGPASVRFTTHDVTATAGDDYTAVATTVFFAPGETVRTVVVPILDDNLEEPTETVRLELTPMAGGGGAVIGPLSVAELRILDDDSPPDEPGDFGRGLRVWWSDDDDAGGKW